MKQRLIYYFQKEGTIKSKGSVTSYTGKNGLQHVITIESLKTN